MPLPRGRSGPSPQGARPPANQFIPVTEDDEEEDSRDVILGAIAKLTAISRRLTRSSDPHSDTAEDTLETLPETSPESDPGDPSPDVPVTPAGGVEPGEALSQGGALSASVEGGSPAPDGLDVSGPGDGQDEPSSGSSDASDLSARGGAMPETTDPEVLGTQTPTAGGGEGGSDATPAPGDAAAGASSDAANSPGGDQPDEKPSQVTVSAEDWEALRSKNRELLDEKKRIQQELRKIKEAQMTDQEKREERFKDLETENAKLKADRRGDAARMAAIQAGAVNPNKVGKLAIAESTSEDDFDFDKYMADLKKESPEFFTRPPVRGGSADGGGGNPPPRRDDVNTLIRRRAGIIQ